MSPLLPAVPNVLCEGRGAGLVSQGRWRVVAPGFAAPWWPRM